MSTLAIAKDCSLCGRMKPLDQFAKGNARLGRQAACKTCVKLCYTDQNKDRINENARRYREANAEKVREGGRRSNLKIRYGIELEDYDRLLMKQGGVCAICKTDDPGRVYFSVDHDHITLEVRGLLCHRCNVALGMFQDSVPALKAAIQYLNRSDD